MQIHGRVLTHLQAMCNEEYFCFMDSDIFATAPLPDLKKILKKENLTGLFAAMPLWVKGSEYMFKSKFKIMMGTFNRKENGTCIGNTYFALYKNDLLRQIIQHYGVCFDDCNQATLPIDIQQRFEKRGYHQTSFDTGKVINFLLNEHKYSLSNIEIPSLCHIGGTSFETTYQEQRQESLYWKKKFRDLIKKTVFNKAIDLRQEYYFKKRFKSLTQEEFQINYNQRVLHRNITRRHFLKLYLALVDNKEIPKSPIFKDEEITKNVAIAHQLYIENFKTYYRAS